MVGGSIRECRSSARKAVRGGCLLRWFWGLEGTPVVRIHQARISCVRTKPRSRPCTFPRQRYAFRTLEPSFVVAYCWRIKPGKEEQFRRAWRRGTLEINRIYGSFGSRLHETTDGRFIGIAEWPDYETWKRAFDVKMFYPDEETRRLFVDAIEASSADGLPLLTMHVTDDLLERTGGLQLAADAERPR